MARKALKPEERRKTVSFTLSGKDLERLDNFIKEENTRLYSVVSRQTVLEGLLLDFLDKQEKSRP